MFKRIYLVLPLFLFSLVSKAQVVQPTSDASSVCADFIYSSDKIKCVEISNGKLFNAKALEICNNIIYSSEKLKCISVIANQSFSKPTLEICANEIFTDKKLECLSKAGLNKASASIDILKRAENQITKALYLIKMHDVNEAQNVLQDLRYELSQKNK